MIVESKIRGFICTTAHPVGCEKHVKEQVEYVKYQGSYDGPKRVLVIGSSTGYGLASRITAAFGSGAKTIGVSYDKPSKGKRTATAGWYNTAAFEMEAKRNGLYAKSIVGDAFSNEIKEEAIDLIKEDLGQIDMLVYSLASPRRKDPKDGEVYSSVLKPIGEDYSNTTIDIMSGELSTVSIEKATDKEIADTIKVMGGEDWRLWIEALKEAGVLAEGFVTTAYSYIGPEITFDIYRDGTIGKAKNHLEKTAFEITENLKDIGGKGYVAVCKALVTQASSAIPVVPLYITLLYRIMKDQGTHEGCIEQIDRLMREKLFVDQVKTDKEGRIRVDDYEMAPEVQGKIDALWETIDMMPLRAVADIDGYQSDFLKLFGFGIAGVDYDADVEVQIPIPSIKEELV